MSRRSKWGVRKVFRTFIVHSKYVNSSCKFKCERRLSGKKNTTQTHAQQIMIISKKHEIKSNGMQCTLHRQVIQSGQSAMVSVVEQNKFW